MSGVRLLSSLPIKYAAAIVFSVSRYAKAMYSPSGECWVHLWPILPGNYTKDISRGFDLDETRIHYSHELRSQKENT